MDGRANGSGGTRCLEEQMAAAAPAVWKITQAGHSRQSPHVSFALKPNRKAHAGTRGAL